MIGAKVKLQVIAFLVISALGITYVGLRYVGLGGALLNDTYVVNADFTESGGIFSGAEVTYRGVTIGKVGQLHLRRDGVRVELRINRDTKVPADITATVANRSAVGEQYVDLRPLSSGRPYLRRGSVIPARRTSTPLPVQTLVLNLDRLVESIDRDDLTTVIDELDRAFSGAGPDLQRLLDSGDALLTEAEANVGPTLDLIRTGKTVLETQRASSDDIRRWAAGLASLSDQLRRSDPDIRRLLAEGPGAATELQDLLTGLRPSIGVWSSLKSPECRTTPWGVSTAIATPSGMLCFTRWNLIRNGPACASPPGRTSRSSVRSRTPCSSSFPSSSASVSAVP